MKTDLYQKEIMSFTGDLSGFEGKNVMISGATGMIASYLIDVLLMNNVNCRIIAIGRNEEKARIRFGDYFFDRRFSFYAMDINKPLIINEKADFVLHTASNTHPMAYSTDPIGTITANVIGLKNLLDYASEHETQRFVFLSSVEIYGENRGDTESFSEDYCGHIDSNTLRAGYPESKRVGEALCQAYIKQNNLNIVIPRLSRVFGPTLQKTDTKALSQFLHKAVAGENIVLKSSGTQYYSYLYVSDIVSGILACLFKGKCGEAYNIADENCNITLKDLAQTIADISGTKVVFETPDETEKAGYSTATKAILDSRKINELGWKAENDIYSGLKKTLLEMD